MEFLKKHIDIVTILLLVLVCYVLFFYGMGHYPLIDVDETRYVSIAEDMLINKDWMTLKLNGEFFFEKPPLFFWLADISFSIFRQIDEVTARIPTALFASLATIAVYLTGKKVVSRNYGVLSALIMATSLEFLVLSRVAILDMLLSSCIIMSILSGFMTFFCEEKNKKFFWWGFYLLSALAVLAKGMPGFVIPFGTLFFAYLFSGKISQIFKPAYFAPGLLIFILITLPWHIAMLNIHGDAFFNKYIMEHHIDRFFSSATIGRKEPWYFFIIVFAIGFLPWTLSFVSMLIDNTKDLINDIKSYFMDFKDKKIFEKWDALDNVKKFLALNVISFGFTFMFFSFASTKLPPYILPLFAPAGFLLGYYWYEYIFEKKYNKKTLINIIILNSLFVATAITALFAPLFLSNEILKDLNKFIVPAILLLTLLPLTTIFTAFLKQRKATFLLTVAMMIGVVIISVNNIFNFICEFGQNDLIEYSLKARDEKAKLATYDFGKRYSIIYYYDGIVDIQTKNDTTWLQEYTAKNPKAYIIVRLSNMEALDKNFSYKTVKTGRKYCLLKDLKHK